MKNDFSGSNPFRILGPKSDTEALDLEKLYEKPFSISFSLEEGVLIMISKIIRITQILSECLYTCESSALNQCESLAKDVHNQEKALTRIVVASDASPELRTGLIRFPYRLERIGDMLENILNCCRTKARDGIPFSDLAHSELDRLFDMLIEMMNNLRKAFKEPKTNLLEVVVSDGEKLNDMFENFKEAHWERLEAGTGAAEASSVYRDILDSIKTVGDYLVKMSVSLLELRGIS
jgi:Na+/phosphate symporter